ncbi:MAG: ATP-dependent Clp protease adaptor ClpS [Planctomycetia bacterium]|nr:MAG: ATP-dependent Clp protease adaptor ClpS [Planctomycetia bacterium]
MPSPTFAEPQVVRETRTLPPYRVILHNDDVNSIEHVVLRILELTKLAEAEAVDCALEAHNTGSSTLLRTHKERAELYCEQFATFTITVTCEPDA